MPFETASDQWSSGLRRLEATPPRDLDPLERAATAIEAELRRRLGSAFTVDELVELYDRDGTMWCTDVARAAAPEHPEAWDATLVADAAFARYLRRASDWAGGRRLG